MVNVLPSNEDKPQDIYSDVANKAKEFMSKEEFKNFLNEQKEYYKNIDIDKLIEKFDEIINDEEIYNRSIAKKPVMTEAYGSGDRTKKKQVKNYLKEKIKELSWEYYTLIGEYIGENIIKAIDTLTPSATKFKLFMKSIVREVYKNKDNLKKPFFWQTPLKLYVIQHEYKSKSIRTKTDFGKISMIKFLDEVEAKEQETGVAPNFVHSLDSTHLFMTILKSYNDYKIDSFITVHDSFATHASDVENLSKALKETFIALHSKPILEEFVAFVKKEFDITINKPIPYVDKDSFDLEQIKKSKYFFA
jgi:DNA-directed RNA polymerase